MSIADALRRLVLRIAFVRRPGLEVNAATRRAMAELEQGKGKRFDSAAALFDDLGV